MTARRWRRFACTPFARGWNVSAPPPGPLPGFGEAELTKEEYDKRVDAYEAKSKAGGLDDGAPRGCQDGSWGPSSISSPIKPPLSMRRVWEEVCREVWTDGRRPPHGGTENGSWWGWAGGGRQRLPERGLFLLPACCQQPSRDAAALVPLHAQGIYSHHKK